MRSVDPDYDPTRRSEVLSFLEAHRKRGEVVTGLLFLDPELPDMHAINQTVQPALTGLPHDKLNPGAEALKKLQATMR